MKSLSLKDNANLLIIITGLIDILLVPVAAFSSFLVKFGFGVVVPLNYSIAVLIGCLVSLICFSVFDVYASMRGRSLSNFFGRLIFAWAVIFFVLVLIVFFTKTGVTFSRQWLANWAIFSLAFWLVFRLFLLLTLRKLRKKGTNLRHIVLIGAGELGQKVARDLKSALWTGYSISTFFDDKSSEAINEIPVLALNNLDAYIFENNIDEIWITLPLYEHQRITNIMHQLRFSTASIRLVPDIFGLNLLRHSLTDVAGIPLLNLQHTPMEGLNRFLKACEDKILAAIIVTIISPILLVLAILVKLSSKGPVFYRQERISWNGKKFMMLKFRSMPVGTENKSGAVWAKAGENRATKIGTFMRKTSLDELPQFLNVLKGDMSIVGPRPERSVFVEKFKDEIPGYMQKHLMKAGITGWAQVNGWRGDTDLKKRVECDLYYIDNWSLAFDIKIVLLTIFKGFLNKNAY